MTAAQKTAKLKFKQAIAYRQKTGVSLKEAFAHIYGKKVGVVKKKAAPKKKSAKKVVRKVVKKVAPKKKAAKKIGYSKVRLEQEKGITKVLKNTPRTLFPYTPKEKIVKAGKKYFDQEFKNISGINIDDYKNLSLGAKKLWKEINKKGFFNFNTEENILIFLYDEAIKKGQYKKAEYLKQLYDIL